jgi:hypothetical protein
MILSDVCMKTTCHAEMSRANITHLLSQACNRLLNKLTNNACQCTPLFSQREEILESRKRRSKQLDAMLVDATERLKDHNSGTRLLIEKEKIDLEKKINIYQRKLETMTGDLDEREVERIIKREALRNDRMKERRERREDEL